MRNAGLRRGARLLAFVAAIGLVFSSFGGTAIMQNKAVDPAARKLPTEKPGTVTRIPLNLVPVPNVPDTCSSVLVDGGFETGGIPNTFWNPETSTNFGTPLCTASCTTGGGTAPPRTGAFWAWFGGIAVVAGNPVAETATLGQTVTLQTGNAHLNFFMRIGAVNTPFADVLNVRVDGAIVASFPEPTVAQGAYSLRSINLTAFANGAAHAILFEYIHPADGGLSNYVVDDVEVVTCSPTAADGSVSGKIADENGAPIAGAVVNLSGSQTRKTITNAFGDYRFDKVETTGFYTVRPSRANYSFNPGERSFSQLGNATDAAFTGLPIGGGGNDIDTPEYFVRQHYLDFLGREPEEAGLNFWSDQMIGCGNDAGCMERRTINVSAAYFLSIEHQETGGLVDRLYRASYGRASLFNEFTPDRAAVAANVIVGAPEWQDTLARNKEEFLNGWVQRPEFRAAYENLGNAAYVDALISHTGVSFTASERDTLVSGLAGGLSRAAALRSIVENGRFVNARLNEAFVRMQYFGYLQRDPDESGFNFWLNKLNQFNGNFEQAEMVKAFISSGEYRDRFGQ